MQAVQHVLVEGGKRYTLCAWIKTEGEPTGCVDIVSAWFAFSGTGGQAASGAVVYDNYKLSIVGRGGSQWTFANDANINVHDSKTKTNHLLEDDKTLPGTALAHVYLSMCYGKGGAYFSDVEFRETPSGAPLAIWITGVEAKANRAWFRKLLHRVLDKFEVVAP